MARIHKLTYQTEQTRVFIYTPPSPHSLPLGNRQVAQRLTPTLSIQLLTVQVAECQWFMQQSSGGHLTQSHSFNFVCQSGAEQVGKQDCGEVVIPLNPVLLLD